MDKKLRMELNVRNSLDAAIVEDLKSAGEIAELDEYVSSEDERTKTANQMKKFLKDNLVPSNTSILLQKQKQKFCKPKPIQS